VVCCRSGVDYDSWDAVLKAHVKPGALMGVSLNVVDYGGIKADPNFAK
jgi:hypothetical protein